MRRLIPNFQSCLDCSIRTFRPTLWTDKGRSLFTNRWYYILNDIVCIRLNEGCAKRNASSAFNHRSRPVVCSSSAVPSLSRLLSLRCWPWGIDGERYEELVMTYPRLKILQEGLKKKRKY